MIRFNLVRRRQVPNSLKQTGFLLSSIKPPAEMAGVVVVFDFDQTLIDGDSDNWVVTQMGLTSLFNHLCSTLPWNSLMDRMMEELHSQGKTANDIAECLIRTPLNPRVIAAIKSAHSLGCELRVISDANKFFIEKILEHHGLLGCFSHSITNPSFVNDEGRLRIFPYHDLSLPPHGCALCPPNMCKGMIIDQIQASSPQKERKRFIYLGDGKGDYCPSLKLGEGDYVMPRKNYPVWELIFSKPLLVKAEVREWSNGEELETILLHLINTILSEEEIKRGNASQLNNSSDFMVPTCDSFTPTLSVPH